MSKSLSESAAEILATSLGSIKKDAMPVGGAAVSYLGGADTEGKPEGDAIGAVASAQAKEAPKPGQSGAPAEPLKSTFAKKSSVIADSEDDEDAVEESVKDDEDELDLTEEELDEYLNSLTEEELEELADSIEESDDELEDDAEQIDETGMSKEETLPVSFNLKDAIAENMGSCAEDIDALFSGESLSEEFKTKATTIFEAAVRSRVEAIVEKIEAESERVVGEAADEFEANLLTQVDEYLNVVVEHWLEENKLAVETGLRAEIAEDFMNGLKNLFIEHYIEVPEEKADLLEELAQQVVEKDEALAEQVKTNEELQKALNESKAVEILRKTCEGLTEVQVSKIKSLAEGVEFTTEGEYLQKLAVIRENYFPSGKKVSESPKTLVETMEPKEVSNIMDRYVTAISKTLPRT